MQTTSELSGAPRRVLVIGAQGFIGSFVAGAFARAGWQVTRGGRRRESAADFRLVDVEQPDTVRDACRAVDLVVSTVRSARLGAERAILETGPTLLNLDDLPFAERTRLKAAVTTPRGLVVDRSGLYGVAMLALVELLARHPEADAVEYGFLVCTAERAGPGGGALIHRLLTGRGRCRTAAVELPRPFGRCRTIETGLGAAGLLPDVVATRSARVYVSFMPAAVNRALLALNALGLASRLPLAAFTAGRGRPPAEPSRQLTAHWVDVRRGGELVASRVISGAGDYRMSTAATLIFADALTARSRPAPFVPGLFAVDEIFTLAELAPALAAGGISIGTRTAS